MSPHGHRRRRSRTSPSKGVTNTFTSTFLRLENDGDSALVAFCGAPLRRDVYFDEKTKRYVAWSEAVEATGQEKKHRFAINVFVVRLASRIFNEMRVWDMSQPTMRRILALRVERGLSRCLFRIARHGAKGDMSTTYEVVPDADITPEQRAMCGSQDPNEPDGWWIEGTVPLIDLERTNSAPAANGSGSPATNGTNSNCALDAEEAFWRDQAGEHGLLLADEVKGLKQALAEQYVPVLQGQEIQGFPKYPYTASRHLAEYMALEDTLTKRFPYDAHFIAHCNPEVDRRIGKDVFDDAEALAEIGGEVRMVLDLFDVDCETSHRASGGTGDTPAPDEWWANEIPKLAALRLKHGNVFAYRTRGGYRIVARLPQPILLRTHADEDLWSRGYLERLSYLQLSFQIFADPACKNFGRLFRLPHATRIGASAPEERETIGEPRQLGTLDFEPSPEIIALADTLAAKKKTASERTTRKKLPRRPGQALASTKRGVLYCAIDARGDLGPEVEPGKWAVKCPWEDAHTKGQRYDTSTVLFAPHSEEGETLGYLHCSHAHCTIRTSRDVLDTFTKEELVAARVRATDSFTPAKEVVGRIPAGSTPSQVEAVFTGELLPLARNCTRVQRTELVAEAKRLQKLSAPTARALGSSLEAAVKEAAQAESEAEEATAERDPSPDNDDDLPVIQLGLDTHRVVDEVLAALPRVKNLYKRGPRLERVVERELDPRQRALDAARQAALEADPNADLDALRPRGFVERPVGSLAIRSYSQSMLKRALSEVVSFVHWDLLNDGWVPCGPPPDVLQCVLEDGEWPGVPVLVGVAAHPLIRGDGTIAQTDGYDPGTGYVLRIPPGMPAIPENPSIDDARARAARLLDLLSDFPWETLADFAAWLCLALTLICRDAFRWPSPLFAITANIRGAGKSRLVDVASIIVTGRPASRATLPHDEAETGKILTAIALEGDPLVLLDNADRPIGNGKFDAWFTAERWKDRLLGVSETIDAPITTAMAVSGNNVSYVGDLVDRVLPVRLMSDLENPRARKDFKIADLLGHVRHHRLERLADLLTIARAWFAAGQEKCPDMTWGSFEGWTSVVPQMVRWLTSLNPLSTRMDIAADDPADVALRVLLAAWRDIEASESVTSLTARHLVETVFDPSGDIREIFLRVDHGAARINPERSADKKKLADVAAALEALAPGRGRDRVNVTRLGYVLRGAKNRPIDGKRLVEAGTTHGSLRWTVR